MGYTTTFEGDFKLDRPLQAAQVAYMRKFAETRRMRRNPQLCGPDPVREAVGLPVGEDGCFFVGGGTGGQDRDASIVDYNEPPTGQPGLWCQWTSNDSGTAIEWDGGEKFYRYTEWIKYMIRNFIGPWGYKLNGTVTWQGEDGMSDTGQISISDKAVTIKKGRIVFE